MSINNVINSITIDGLGINIILLFMTIIFWGLKPINKLELAPNFLMAENRSNKIIDWRVIAIIILISLFFYTPAIGEVRAGYPPKYMSIQ